MTIDTIIASIIDREGGYVNDHSDHGGPTNYGITLKTLEQYHHKDVTASDIEALTKEEAAKIYKSMYFYRPKIDRLPDGLQQIVCDMAVMSGPEEAIKILQEVASFAGNPINIDGNIGKLTVHACNIAINDYGISLIIDQIVRDRIKFLKNIVSRDPSQSKFLVGWINRTKGFIVT